MLNITPFAHKTIKVVCSRLAGCYFPTCARVFVNYFLSASMYILYKFVQLQRLPSETPTFLTPDSLPRFTHTECEDHKCMSSAMSTHHQLFETEGSTVITKKEAFSNVLSDL